VCLAHACKAVKLCYKTAGDFVDDREATLTGLFTSRIRLDLYLSSMSRAGLLRQSMFIGPSETDTFNLGGTQGVNGEKNTDSKRRVRQTTRKGLTQHMHNTRYYSANNYDYISSRPELMQ
jgi:hypothetical protein